MRSVIVPRSLKSLTLLGPMAFVWTIRQVGMSVFQHPFDFRIIRGDVTHDSKRCSGSRSGDLVVESGNTGFSVGKGEEMQSDTSGCILYVPKKLCTRTRKIVSPRQKGS